MVFRELTSFDNFDFTTDYTPQTRALNLDIRYVACIMFNIIFISLIYIIVSNRYFKIAVEY